MPKLTKATGYWLFMNNLMREKDYRGQFRPFAARWDHLWQLMTAAEKQEWKDRANTIKHEVGEYRGRYLPLERALKRGYHDEDESQRLVVERALSIDRILDLTV